MKSTAAAAPVAVEGSGAGAPQKRSRRRKTTRGNDSWVKFSPFLTEEAMNTAVTYPQGLTFNAYDDKRGRLYTCDSGEVEVTAGGNAFIDNYNQHGPSGKRRSQVCRAFHSLGKCGIGKACTNVHISGTVVHKAIHVRLSDEDTGTLIGQAAGGMGDDKDDEDVYVTMDKFHGALGGDGTTEVWMPNLLKPAVAYAFSEMYKTEGVIKFLSMSGGSDEAVDNNSSEKDGNATKAVTTKTDDSNKNVPAETGTDSTTAPEGDQKKESKDRSESFSALQHCAHYLRSGVCHLGPACRFVHVVMLKPEVSAALALGAKRDAIGATGGGQREGVPICSSMPPAAMVIPPQPTTIAQTAPLNAGLAQQGIYSAGAVPPQPQPSGCRSAKFFNPFLSNTPTAHPEVADGLTYSPQQVALGNSPSCGSPMNHPVVHTTPDGREFHSGDTRYTTASYPALHTPPNHSAVDVLQMMGDVCAAPPPPPPPTSHGHVPASQFGCSSPHQQQHHHQQHQHHQNEHQHHYQHHHQQQQQQQHHQHYHHEQLHHHSPQATGAVETPGIVSAPYHSSSNCGSQYGSREPTPYGTPTNYHEQPPVLDPTYQHHAHHHHGGGQLATSYGSSGYQSSSGTPTTGAMPQPIVGQNGQACTYGAPTGDYTTDHQAHDMMATGQEIYKVYEQSGELDT